MFSTPKKKDESGIPLNVGRIASLVAGFIIGKQAGEGLAEYTSEKLALSENEADYLEFGLETVGVVGASFAMWNLANRNPDKSFIVGLKSLGGIAAIAGIKHVTEELKSLREDLNHLHPEIKRDDLHSDSTDLNEACLFTYSFNQSSSLVVDYSVENSAFEKDYIPEAEFIYQTTTDQDLITSPEINIETQNFTSNFDDNMEDFEKDIQGSFLRSITGLSFGNTLEPSHDRNIWGGSSNHDIHDNPRDMDIHGHSSETHGFYGHFGNHDFSANEDVDN
jgi:hypothetical protein